MNTLQGRLEIDGHFIPISPNIWSKCKEWIQEDNGSEIIYICKSNPNVRVHLPRNETEEFD